MATNLTWLINYVDAAVAYATTPADYIEVDVDHDYLIWTEGDSTVKDLMTSMPSEADLNAAGAAIDADAAYTVPLCLLMDYSGNVGGAYYTHKVIGMSENNRYVFCFSFDGSTATEPQLECWDDDGHDSFNKHVLGAGTAVDSMVKGICTTAGLPGASWTGTALAGDNVARVLLLNNGNGALADLESGETSQELYANLKIVLPADYPTPEAASFVMTVRYAWN